MIWSLRAARALQQPRACPLGAHIGVEKRIPAQAGMGGGSSDAASHPAGTQPLVGAEAECACQLAPIGLKLGADVPFFLGGHNAWVEGIGEQMTPIQLPDARFVVVKPEPDWKHG
jgi:4-diphosphocytidyl-2-C-methyl-D-erythritol kinase